MLGGGLHRRIQEHGPPSSTRVCTSQQARRPSLLAPRLPSGQVCPSEAQTVCAHIAEMITGVPPQGQKRWFPGSQPVSLDGTNLELLRQRRLGSGIEWKQGEALITCSASSPPRAFQRIEPVSVVRLRVPRQQTRWARTFCQRPCHRCPRTSPQRPCRRPLTPPQPAALSPPSHATPATPPVCPHTTRRYWVTWKADGTRYMLVILPSGTYLVDRKLATRRCQMRWPTAVHAVPGRPQKAPVGPPHTLVRACGLVAGARWAGDPPHAPFLLSSSTHGRVRIGQTCGMRALALVHACAGAPQRLLHPPLPADYSGRRDDRGR